jgi:REP element-mobilizing transposase RayT
VRELPQRKPTRLKGYDYSRNGAYFMTVCAKDRAELLGQIVGDAVGDAVHSVPPPPSVPSVPPHIELSEYGKVVEGILRQGGNPDIRLDRYIIMQNHIHMILIISRNGDRDGVDTVPYKSLVSTFVRSVKTMTTKEIGFSLWQRSFHDHVIRNEADYSRIAEYIEQNPTKWEEDCFYCL